MNARDTEPGSLIVAARLSEIVSLVESGADRTACAAGVRCCHRGDDTPAEVVAAPGLEVVSDDGALVDADDAAFLPRPEVLEMIRHGNVQAADAVIGAVMKSMDGKADTARVRKLLLERPAFRS